MTTDRELIEAAMDALRVGPATVTQLTWYLRYSEAFAVDADRLHRLLNLAASWGCVRRVRVFGCRRLGWEAVCKVPPEAFSAAGTMRRREIEVTKAKGETP